MHAGSGESPVETHYIPWDKFLTGRIFHVLCTHTSRKIYRKREKIKRIIYLFTVYLPSL